MYFSVSNISLLQKLRLLHRIIKSNNKNSEHFIFEIFGEKLIIMFSDSENIITTEIRVYVKKYSEGKVSVHSQLIIDILSTFLDEIIFIKFIKEKKILNIRSKQGNYDIPILWDQNHILNDFFKNLKKIEKKTKKITIFSNVLFNILKKTSFIIENKEELPTIINGVFFQFSSEGSTFVATDTYKLVKYTINHIQLDQLIEFILPKESIKILKKFLLINKPNKKSKVIIEYRNKIDIKFHFLNETFSCLLRNEKYPNYNSVIPPVNKYDVLFIINRILFLNSIKRISLLSNLNKKKTSFIRFYFDKKLKIYEEYDENIYSFLTIKYEFIDNSLQKKEIKIGFNSKFLIEILSSFNEDFVSFELYTSNKVGILRPINNQNKRKESILILIMSIII